MKKTIGDRIKELRVLYNMNVKQSGILCNLSYMTIYSLEKGKRTKPHDTTLNKIADAFGSSIGWITSGTGEIQPGGSNKIQKKTLQIRTPETYLELKIKSDLLEKELERLRLFIEEGSYCSPRAKLN